MRYSERHNVTFRGVADFSLRVFGIDISNIDLFAWDRVWDKHRCFEKYNILAPYSGVADFSLRGYAKPNDTILFAMTVARNVCYSGEICSWVQIRMDRARM